jgi:hypothetical protein
METNLRPMTLGEILDRTAQLYRTNFELFAGIASVYAGVTLAINLASLGMLDAVKGGEFLSPLSWVRQILTWTSVIVMLIVGNVAAAANNRAVAWVHLGEPATIAGAYRSILRDTGRYLGLGALKLLLAWTPLILLYGAFQASAIHFQLKGVLPRPGEIPQPGATPSPESLIFVLITLAFGVLIWPVGVYAVWMSLRYALALPASVVENLKVRTAIKRSISLGKGARGRIFVLWLLVWVIEFMVMGVTQAFFVAYTLRHHYQIPVGLQVAQQIVAFFTNSFIGPILATGTTLFYYDQRVRKEGYDIEWMMAAAGLGGVAPVGELSGNAEPVPAAENTETQRDLESRALHAAQDGLSPDGFSPGEGA